MGAGGLGSVIGGYLARSGVHVTLVGRQAHADTIRTSGLRIDCARGDVVVQKHLDAVTSVDDIVGEFDYFILAVKAKDTVKALGDAAQLLNRFACALTLQNGVSKDEVLAQWCGADRVIGASITDAGTLVAPGHVAHKLTADVTAYVGELDGSESTRTTALASALSEAGLSAQATDEIVNVEWEKLAQICIAATWATSSFGASGASIADGWVVREGIEQYIAIGKDVLSVYRAMGYQPRNFYAPLAHLQELDNLPVDEMIAYLDRIGRSMRKRGVQVHPSMHQDLLNGRVTEADQIVLPFLREAESRGIDVPTLRGAYRIIKTIESVVGAKT